MKLGARGFHVGYDSGCQIEAGLRCPAANHASVLATMRDGSRNIQQFRLRESIYSSYVLFYTRHNILSSCFMSVHGFSVVGLYEYVSYLC